MIKSKMNSVDDVSKFIVKSHLKENSTLRIYDAIYQSGAIRSFSISSKTGDIRGNHSHTRSRQWFTVVQGRISVEVYDGKDAKTFLLQDSNEILLVPAGIWSRQIYSENSTLLVFTDTQYDETDYIRSFAEFKQWKTK